MKKVNPNQTMTLAQTLDSVAKIETKLTDNHSDKWSKKYVPVSLEEMVRNAYGAGYEVHTIIEPRGKKKDEASKNGAYVLRAINPQVQEFMGDKVQSELYISNSFDAKRSLRVSLGMYRQVCSNGLMMGVTVSAIKARHTTGIIEQVNGLELVDPWVEIERAYGWMSQKIEDQKAFSVIQELGLSQKAQDSIIELYKNPLRIEDKRGDVWSLYNVVNEGMEQRARSSYRFFTFNDNLNEMIKKAYEGIK